MSSSIIFGLLGALVAVFLGVTITKLAANKVTKGRLQHGLWLSILGLVCLVFSIYLGWRFFLDASEKSKFGDIVIALVLIISFGLAALGCFIEYFKVKGYFDSDKITFYTPWTGTKEEHWDNLVSVHFNAVMYWFVLEFESCEKIRISPLLIGYGELKEQLIQKGIEV